MVRFGLSKEQFELILDRSGVLLHFVGLENISHLHNCDCASVLFVDNAPHLVPVALGQLEAVSIRTLFHFLGEAMDFIKEVSALIFVEIAFQVLIQVDKDQFELVTTCFIVFVLVFVSFLLIT